MEWGLLRLKPGEKTEVFCEVAKRDVPVVKRYDTVYKGDEEETWNPNVYILFCQQPWYEKTERKMLQGRSKTETKNAYCGSDRCPYLLHLWKNEIMYELEKTADHVSSEGHKNRPSWKGFADSSLIEEMERIELEHRELMVEFSGLKLENRALSDGYEKAEVVFLVRMAIEAAKRGNNKKKSEVLREMRKKFVNYEEFVVFDSRVNELQKIMEMKGDK